MSFLVVEISQENGKFVTTIYLKPIFSGVYTHFEILVPSIHKFGMTYILLHKCFTLCSDWTKFHRELVIHFPKKWLSGIVFGRVLRSFNIHIISYNKLRITKSTLAIVERKPLYLVLPYFGLIPLQVRNKIRIL